MSAPTPTGIRLLVLLLFVSPLIQTWAASTGRRFLTLGGTSWGSWLSWCFAAPLVALLLLRRDGRARFSCYLLLTVFLWRGFRAMSPAAIVLALSIVAYLQLPAVRRVYPRIDSESLIARLRRLRH
ncbi:MAG TPA: hypothetical protein VD788_16305 [Candidatus Polarisedimenticolaceae bacterium]|nr:hypothetical protein [Candidatus Polarisedimenticolaceae bacterium]